MPVHPQAYDFNNTSPKKQKARTFTDPGSSNEAESLLGAQAFLHEGLAFVASQCLGLGIGVAGLHLVFMRSASGFGGGGFCAQAFLH